MNTIREVMRCKVESLELSVRSSNCMKRAGIQTLEELTKIDAEELSKTKNFGKKSLEEIVGKLAAIGLGFNMDEKAWASWGLAHLSLIKNLHWEMI